MRKHSTRKQMATFGHDAADPRCSKRASDDVASLIVPSVLDSAFWENVHLITNRKTRLQRFQNKATFPMPVSCLVCPPD